MNNERWQEIQDLFHEASEISASEQFAYLRARCNGDHELFHRVGRMLESDRAGSFLDREILPIADEVLGEPEALPFDAVGPYRILEKSAKAGWGWFILRNGMTGERRWRSNFRATFGLQEIGWRDLPQNNAC